ncbi:MAG TPA: hypothetical protein VJ794_00195, partial [Gemmatimonadales bacterium]|nr:hypothetical protein [Gemmatimonadales bacterium]
AGGGEQQSASPGAIPVKYGSTRPIRFRIEQGVLQGVFAEVEAGLLHSCGLTPGGQVYCWGANNAGQLGDDNAPVGSDTPVPVAGGHVFQALSVGYVHNCALESGGQAYCWGSNIQGQLGDGNTGVDSDMPVPVTGGHAFASISAGGDHTCALTSAGEAYCWGENFYGGLGDGNAPTDSDMPVLVLGGHVFESISAGLVHTCAVASTGIGYCWGSNGKGRLGNGNAGIDSPTPTPVAGGHLFHSISAGGLHTCGLTTAAAVYCWGYGLSGQLGNGNAGIDQDIPVLVLGGHPFESVDTGDEHTCGVVSGGDAYCWGNDGLGQLGDGSGPPFTDVPSLVSGGHAFQAVSAGERHSCGLSPIGVARCWGGNQDGRLGDGNAPFGSGVPVEVAFP